MKLFLIALLLLASPFAFSADGATCDFEPLYVTDERTLDEMLTVKMDEMRGSGMAGWITAFFTVDFGGSCPVWRADLPLPGDAGLDISFQCSPEFVTAMDVAGYVLLFLASLAAIRIIFL